MSYIFLIPLSICIKQTYLSDNSFVFFSRGTQFDLATKLVSSSDIPGQYLKAHQDRLHISS